MFCTICWRWQITKSPPLSFTVTFPDKILLPPAIYWNCRLILIQLTRSPITYLLPHFKQCLINCLNWVTPPGAILTRIYLQDYLCGKLYSSSRASHTSAVWRVYPQLEVSWISCSLSLFPVVQSLVYCWQQPCMCTQQYRNWKWLCLYGFLGKLKK